MTTPLDEAKQELRDAARAFAANEQAETRLTIAAVQLARAMRNLADGVDYAKRQAAEEERRGVRLCPSCMQVKVVRATAVNSPSVWVEPKSLKPHFCRGGK